MNQKTKTIFAKEALSNSEYKRGLDQFLVKYQSLSYAKVLIMARYRMLDCANNYSIKSGGKMCCLCKEIDDENHRINWCKKWEGVNLCDSQAKADFQDIYCSDDEKIIKIVETIASLLDLEW